MSDETVHKTEREIEEDVMNVPFIAWLGSISTVLIVVAVLLLTGVFYLTQRQQTAERQADADARITELEAQRAIDAISIFPESKARAAMAEAAQFAVARGY